MLFLNNLNMKKVLFICLVMAGLFVSCGVEQHTTNNKGHLFIEVFQTLSNGENSSTCLARNSNWDIFYIISLDCPDKTTHEMYYDGKNISGAYVLVGTYTYETKGGDTKTVQACMKKNNYNDLYNYDKEFLKELLDIALSYNLVK